MNFNVNDQANFNFKFNELDAKVQAAIMRHGFGVQQMAQNQFNRMAEMFQQEFSYPLAETINGEAKRLDVLSSAAEFLSSMKINGIIE